MPNLTSCRQFYLHEIHPFFTILFQIFAGNTDTTSKKTTVFPTPVFARYIRLVVRSWQAFIALRLEYLSCWYDLWPHLLALCTVAYICSETISNKFKFRNVMSNLTLNSLLAFASLIFIRIIPKKFCMNTLCPVIYAVCFSICSAGAKCKIRFNDCRYSSLHSTGMLQCCRWRMPCPVFMEVLH